MIAASLPSPRVMLVCITMVVRPICSGVVTARAVSPLGIGAKKLVLLSMVAVRWPSGRAAKVVIPPMVSAQPMIAPPCITLRRLHRSSRMNNSASLRSAVRLMIFTPRSLTNGAGSHAAMLDPCLAVVWRSPSRAIRAFSGKVESGFPSENATT